MGTTIRPELSEKNPYWIEKHRYYELKHFCLQYPIWRKAYSVLDGYSNPPKDLASFVVTSTLGDPTAKCAMKAYSEAIMGMDSAAITNSATAGKALVELANTIPNTGGLSLVLSLESVHPSTTRLLIKKNNESVMED